MNKDGQVGLLLLVIMGVVVALIMSVASRSLSDTVLSRQERESSAAFSVAETGIETAFNQLRQGTVQNGVISTFNDSLGFGTGQYGVFPTSTYSMFLREGESANLNLTGYPSATIDIYWTKKADTSENIAGCVQGSGTASAGIEINAIQQSLDKNVLSYVNSFRCTSLAAGFLNAQDGGATYLSKYTYTIPASTNVLRIKPIFSGATIQVSGAGLTTQLYKVQASGKGGDAQKEIEVKRGLDAPASIFDFAVFSGGTIVK